MKKSYNLNIVVALPCEAKVINEYFKLTKIMRNPTFFPIFRNKSQNIHLLISGIGRVNMAAAVAYLHLFSGQNTFNCFLNIGIAGSNTFQMGQAVLINKVIEGNTDRRWYPFTTPLKYPTQGSLYTYDQTKTSYPSGGLVDMEGSAFFQAANSFVTQEQIQLLKIISDNDIVTQQCITPEKVIILIQQNLEAIQTITNYLTNLSKREAEIDFNFEELDQFKQQWHFTHSQELELKNYLQRWQNLNLGSAWHVCRNKTNASRVIESLMKELNQIICQPDGVCHSE
jgi:hypothetical protein